MTSLRGAFAQSVLVFDPRWQERVTETGPTHEELVRELVPFSPQFLVVTHLTPDMIKKARADDDLSQLCADAVSGGDHYDPCLILVELDLFGGGDPTYGLTLVELIGASPWLGRTPLVAISSCSLSDRQRRRIDPHVKGIAFWQRLADPTSMTRRLFSTMTLTDAKFQL